MLQSSGGPQVPGNWQNMVPVPQPQWYQVTCPNCGSQLQVQLPEGITSVQCGNCKAVFAVQIQQTNYNAQAKPPGPMSVKRGRKKKDKPARPPRSPSAYNLFMKDEVSNVKREHPELRHRDAFKMAAERWADSPRNPQNKDKPGYIGMAGSPAAAEGAPGVLDDDEGDEDEGDEDEGEGADAGGGGAADAEQPPAGPPAEPDPAAEAKPEAAAAEAAAEPGATAEAAAEGSAAAVEGAPGGEAAEGAEAAKAVEGAEEVKGEEGAVAKEGGDGEEDK